ncbi:hydrolase [Photobacterium jeanii]|uniref:Hydrolase n=1 Tax=Photobacterium jeanii TaxID=858640 RepID=A0A178K3I0_9GAMM|nr:hydrolase [Photobacterium jeanii]OAN11505.1 hydrolase [Photobacterium jeanii]PST91024.1 hydrolase [Photobacterium jeanii]
MLDADNTALVIIDVQGKLAQIMDQHQALFEQLETMVKGAQILQLPILWVEQIPDKLGATIPQLQALLTSQAPIAKNTFSACGNREFLDALEATQCTSILVVGIEAHICVYQTAMDLHRAGHHVEVVTDAVSSRTKANKQLALNKMSLAGIKLTSTEMALFELQKVAQGEQFKQLISIIK